MIRYALGLLLAALVVQSVAGQHIEEIGIYVGASDSLVQRAFGQPHLVTHYDEKDAVIWTFFRAEDNKPPALEVSESTFASYVADTLASPAQVFNLLPIAQHREGKGYFQFAFWNGKVAAVSMQTTGPEATPLYEASLAFLKEHGNWLGKGPSVTPAGIPAGNSRFTRMGDNIWGVHADLNQAIPRTILRVGDAGYLQCSKVRMSELQRVKAAFGVDLEAQQ